MKRIRIALLVVLSMLISVNVAFACCIDECCTNLSNQQTMEETCPCLMNGSECPCVSGGEGCICASPCPCSETDPEKRLELLENRLNAVFEKNADLWNRFFGMMNKQPDMGMSYADYLTEQLEASKDNFTNEEYELLQLDIETIRNLDSQISELSEVIASTNQNAGEDMSEKFPAFEGMDLNGNSVTDELFGENAVTVINFWFSTCSPCIDELDELNALNEKLRQNGGEVIGINADTIGGNESMISQAKAILEKKGAEYRNIYFSADSDAGQLTYSITAFPTTMVVDRGGNIVGEPILGGINNENQMNTLQSLINEVLEKDNR